MKNILLLAGLFFSYSSVANAATLEVNVRESRQCGTEGLVRLRECIDPVAQQVEGLAADPQVAALLQESNCFFSGRPEAQSLPFYGELSFSDSGSSQNRCQQVRLRLGAYRNVGEDWDRLTWPSNLQRILAQDSEQTVRYFSS